jgi:pimeloyl-ACP methyl ester carboxylesterase
MTAAVDVREGYVQVTGGRVWYRVVGGGGPIPLVTVHGGPGGVHDYLAPVGALPDERPVVLYEELGAGRSDALDDVSLWTDVSPVSVSVCFCRSRPPRCGLEQRASRPAAKMAALWRRGGGTTEQFRGPKKISGWSS